MRPRFSRPWELACALVVSLCACQSTDGPFVDVGVESGRCARCHMTEYLAVKRPAHAGVKPTTCGVCHSSSSWHPALLNHPFSLTGAHAKADCFECHRGNPPVFQGTRSECVACHRGDYDASRFPGHNRFPLTCAECHSTLAWNPALKETVAGASTAERKAAPPAPPIPVPSSISSMAPKPRRPTPNPVPAPVVPPAWTSTPVTPPRPTIPTSTPPDSVTGASRGSRR